MTSRFLPVARLVELAQSGAAMALPFGTRQSYPIPVRRSGGEPKGLSVEFVYAPHGRLNPVEGLRLLTPTFLARYDASTGRLDHLGAITRLAGQTPDQDIGAHVMPAGLTYDTFMQLQTQLFQRQDLVLPSFADDARQLPAEIEAAARELGPLFWRLSEAPLAPYYRSIGSEFFDWLAAVAP